MKKQSAPPRMADSQRRRGMQLTALAAIAASVLLSIFLVNLGNSYYDEWTLPGQFLGLAWGFYWFRKRPFPELLLATCGGEVFGMGLCTLTSFTKVDFINGESFSPSMFYYFIEPYLQTFKQPVSLMFKNLTNFIDEIACWGLTVALPWNAWLKWGSRRS